MNVGSSRANTIDSEPQDSANNLRPGVQQTCLNIFRDALGDSQDALLTVQEVKRHLYNRDFSTAFSRPEYLQAYALRWSASRALGYGNIFLGLRPHLESEKKALRIVCIGGGAGAELVGLAAWLNSCSKTSAMTGDDQLATKLDIKLVDIANWSRVITSLYNGITKAPKLSQYASESARARNVAFLMPEQITSDFIQADVLGPADTWKHAMKDTDLITIMFTLNELYSTSMSKTQAFLKDLTAAARSGTLLLVVDSPGSYSTIQLNGGEKKYPMHWLLDHTLLATSSKLRTTQQWTKLQGDDSSWFRMPQGLQYPVELENMRYQTHLYRRLDQPAP